MSNASRCQRLADHYAELAERAEEARAKTSYRRLEGLWREMAPLAETFDRSTDPQAKQRIYAMIDEVEEVLREVA